MKGGKTQKGGDHPDGIDDSVALAEEKPSSDDAEKGSEPTGFTMPAMKGGRRRRSRRSRRGKKHSKHSRRSRKSRRTRRRRRTRGGSGLFSAARTALIPFALFKAQKHAQKRSRKSSRRTRKSRK